MPLGRAKVVQFSRKAVDSVKQRGGIKSAYEQAVQILAMKAQKVKS